MRDFSLVNVVCDMKLLITSNLELCHTIIISIFIISTRLLAQRASIFNVVSIKREVKKETFFGCFRVKKAFLLLSPKLLINRMNFNRLHVTKTQSYFSWFDLTTNNKHHKLMKSFKSHSSSYIRQQHQLHSINLLLVNGWLLRFLSPCQCLIERSQCNPLIRLMSALMWPANKTYSITWCRAITKAYNSLDCLKYKLMR